MTQDPALSSPSGYQVKNFASAKPVGALKGTEAAA
jgi:hypothetical protein